MGCFWGSCNNNWNRHCCNNWNNDCNGSNDDCEEEKRRAYWRGYWDGYRHCGCRWDNNNDDDDCGC
ncbi:hypothetical protein LXJ15735_23490 [Lacrimispora xylanolytica]